LVERSQQLQRERFGQVCDEVGEVVELHAFGDRRQLLRVHALHQLRADVLVQLDEHFAFELGVDHVPDELTLRGRERFDEQRDFGGMKGIHHPVRGTQRALAQRSAER